MPRPKKEQPNHAGGLYEVKITVGKTMEGKLLRKSFYSDISKADAKEKAEQWKIEREVANQTSSVFVEKDMAFSAWADKWLEIYKKPYVSENTYNGTYLLYVEKHLKPYFKSVDLKNIKPADIQKFYSAHSGLSESALHKISLCLKGIFETAIDNDLCYKNPTRYVDYKSTQTPTEKQTYTDDQIMTFYKYARSEMPGAVLIIETGLRCGELVGLQWADIYDDAIHVKRSIAISKVKGEFTIRPPKWNSYRAIPLSKDAKDALARLTNNDEYVFPRKPGIPYTPRTWGRYLLNYMTALHEKEPSLPILSPHELRHTCGTRLRRKGVDIYTIQKVMGHKDIKITTEIYVHNEIEILRKSMGL